MAYRKTQRKCLFFREKGNSNIITTLWHVRETLQKSLSPEWTSLVYICSRRLEKCCFLQFPVSWSHWITSDMSLISAKDLRLHIGGESRVHATSVVLQHWHDWMYLWFLTLLFQCTVCDDLSNWHLETANHGEGLRARIPFWDARAVPPRTSSICPFRGRGIDDSICLLFKMVLIFQFISTDPLRWKTLLYGWHYEPYISLGLGPVWKLH